MNTDDFIEGYSKYLEIDRHNLDQEVSRLPALFFTVADRWAQAIRIRDKLAQELQNREALVGEKIRQRAGLNKEKITEGGIKTKIDLDASVGIAREKYKSATHKAQRLEMLKLSYIQKSHSLRAVVDLSLNESRQNSSMGKVSAEATQDAIVNRNRARINEERQRLRGR